MTRRYMSPSTATTFPEEGSLETANLSMLGSTFKAKPLLSSLTCASGQQYSLAPITKAQKSFLLLELGHLKRRSSAEHFKKPVNTTTYPTYLEEVEHPMDLETLTTQLHEDKFTSVQDFMDNFDLIVKAARLFNGDDAEVTKDAEEMSGHFKRKLARIPSVDDPYVRPSRPRKKTVSWRAMSREGRDPSPLDGEDDSIDPDYKAPQAM